MKFEVIIWLCPTPECGNYYASSSRIDLKTAMNTRLNSSKATFPLSRCPDCRDRGIDVDRVPVELVATL